VGVADASDVLGSRATTQLAVMRGTEFAGKGFIYAFQDIRGRFRSGGEYARAFGNASAGRYPAGVPSPRQFPSILEALERAGFKSAEIDAIAGRNFLRAFRAIWG
jgi:microsomal dipeptidase-like Zn-dependent dipeptidase